MSNFWNKFAHNLKTANTRNIASTKLNHQVPKETSSISQKGILITHEDEILFKNSDSGSDPLGITSQIAQTLIEALSQKNLPISSYTFFAEYLESKEVHFLMMFLDEIEKYQRSFLLSGKQHTIAPVTLINNEPKQCKTSCNCVLPDLVSNIPKDVVVTPHNSPQEETVSFSSAHQDLSQNKCNLDSDDPCDAASPSLSFSEHNVHRSTAKLKEENGRCLSLAKEIFMKYIDSKSECSVEVSTQEKMRIEEKLNSGEVDQHLFSNSKDEIIFVLEGYYSKYVESQYFLKHEIEILTGEKVLLIDVLRSESALPYFMEYLEQESSQNLLEFWISVSNFRNHLHNDKTKNAEQSQMDAMILYDKYFSLQARTPIGFSDEIRLKVESNICQEGGPQHDCFDVPLRIVLNVVQRDHLRGYLSSSLHMNLLRELVNKVKIHSKHSRKGSASNMSTGSSEQSCSTAPSKVTISEKNTLLAMDSSHGLELLKGLSDPGVSMRIDSNQILDPDSLWRRKNFTKLSCGYVDQYGRFESDIQPDPDKKESRISKTLKKKKKKKKKKI